MVVRVDAVDGQSVRAHLLEWREPVGKDSSRGFIVLQKDAANLPGAIIQIEIGREFFSLRFERATFPEVRRHIGLRSQRALLLGTPQTEANRAARVQVEQLDQ